ncbi:unnamed protein product, partial [Didymodactylos carnosus]
YSYGLLKLGKCCKPIDFMYMENLSSMFVTESLKLGIIDFANEINLNRLEILKFEENKQKFKDENVFVLLDGILLLNENYSTKVLEILQIYTIDNLYMSINSRRRHNSFKLLEKARQNQDLPDSIFYKSEVAKAGFALSRSTNKKPIIKFMQDQTNNGMELPIDTVNALENEIGNEGVLQIFYNISKNKQIIQYDLLNKLIEIFNPNRNQFIFFKKIHSF